MKRWAGDPWRRLGLSARIGWLVVGVYSVAGLVVVTSSLHGWRGPYSTRPADEIATVVCLLFAAACAGYAARPATRRQRFGWLALVTGLLGWAVGEIIWAVCDVRPELAHATQPATAEVIFVLWPVGAMASLVLLSRLSRHSPRRLVLDGLIVATSLFVISWVFVVDKQLRADSGSRLATLAEVFNDVVLLTTAILMLSRARPGELPSCNLLPGGVATISIADIAMVFRTGIGSYHVGYVGDLVRVAGLGMLALAALASRGPAPAAQSVDPIPSRRRLWVPYLPLLLAAAVGFRHAVGTMPHGPLLTALGILLAAVLARQFVVLTENQSLLSKVVREAFRDSLTGLANRAYFLHRLEQAVARRHQDDTPIAVLSLDLDNFKAVNDALGHPAGDELLIRVAGRLTAALGDNGVVARLGGDEFAVLLVAPVEESRAAAQRILDAFRAAIVVDGVPVHVRPSIGFTVATAASTSTVEQLLRHADVAMYTAKREGGQCVRSFILDLPFSESFPPLTDSAVSALEPNSAATAYEAVADTLGPTSAAGNGTTGAGARQPTDEAEASAPGHRQDPTDGVRWPPTGIRIALAALAIGVLAFIITSVVYPDAGHSVLFVKTLYSGLNLFAAALIAIRAYRVVADRMGWSLIASGMALSAVGDLVYAQAVPNGQSPSAADPAYLSSYPLVFAGLLLLMRARSKRVPTALRFDSLVCTLTGAAVAAALIAGPIHTAAARTPKTVLVGVLYPWGDLALLALAAGMLPIVGWRNGFRWVLLAAGFMGFAIADTAYLFQTAAGSYRVGTALDSLWPASSLLVAMAGWVPWSSAAPLARRGLGSYTVPVACTVAALAVAVLGHHSLPASTLAALSLIAVAVRLSVTFREVSMQAQSHQHAMSDELTALPNRRSLATALTGLPGSASAETSPVASLSSRRALLLLGLCEFQEISDSIGAHFGDELLCHIANRLAHSVRREDMLARVSADQFAVLLPEGSDLTAARAQAGRLLEAMGDPFELDPITVQVDAHIAIALCPDHCDHPQELLTRAETALLHAKSAFGKIAVYDSTHETYSDNDPHLIEELRAALVDGDELTLYYQPKINAGDGSVHSVEALLRWHHPRRGLLLPDEFLPAAERAGLNRRIANRTINLALEQVRNWRDQGMTLAVAVNLSTTNLLDLDLAVTIERLLLTHGLPPEALIMEITESALVDSERSRNTVAALQALGVRISLDDYGTGWSSLARLQDVSVDELKLDRIFVTRLAKDPRSVAIVRSTVALAGSLGADLVAEGVEDQITLSALRRYGCTITQGYVHSPPLPPQELQRWISTHAANTGSTQPEQAGVSD